MGGGRHGGWGQGVVSAPEVEGVLRRNDEEGGATNRDPRSCAVSTVAGLRSAALSTPMAATGCHGVRDGALCAGAAVVEGGVGGKGCVEGADEKAGVWVESLEEESSVVAGPRG